MGMQLRLAVPAVVLAVAGASLPAHSAPTRQQAWGDFGAATGTPTAWASRALRHELGSRAADFRWEVVRTSLVGQHVRGRQYRGGVPVAGTDVLVSEVGGRVVQVEAHGTQLPGAPASHPVGEVVARAAALGRLGVTRLLAPLAVHRVLAPHDGRLVDTYQVSVISRTAVARVDVDAASGWVLGVVHDGLRARTSDTSGTARVFDPNPVVTSRNTALRQPLETNLPDLDVPLPSAALTAQLRTVPVTFSTPSTELTGSWAHILFPLGYTGSSLDFVRSDPRFVGAMAYVHIDRYQRWLQSLGLRNVNASPQSVIALTTGDDNSQYIGGSDVILYGGGGVPDAEDAEIVLHEYGHAMQDDQMPGVSASGETGAMGEGFGDFNAANYFALTSGGFGDLCVGDWDATSYSTANPPCLRRLDSRKHWPKDDDGDAHDNGEMWSAYLWRLRSHLGTTTTQRSVNAIKLVVTAQELMSPDGSFRASVTALRVTANAMRHPDWARWVDAEARTSGFA